MRLLEFVRKRITPGSAAAADNVVSMARKLATSVPVESWPTTEIERMSFVPLRDVMNCEGSNWAMKDAMAFFPWRNGPQPMVE